MVPTSIYDFLKTELLSGTHPNLAAFSDWLQEYINQYEPYKGTDQVDIVDTAMNYPDLFDVYFTRHGYMSDRSFVICKAGLSIPQIYKELELNEYRDFSLNEFYYHLFTVDEDGHINPTAIAKELKFPEHMIFNGGWKYSYNLKDEPYKVETYTSIEDKTLYKDELDEFKLKNELPKDYDHTDWTEFHNKLKTQFGLSDEEAEDLMINYFNIYSKIKSSVNESLNEDKRQKYLYSYGGPVYRFERLYSEYWEGYTEAVSLKEAIRNLNQQAKKYFGFTPDAKLNIDPDYVLYNDESSEEEFEEHRTCPNCGRRLTPSGECVLCDLNDESVLDEGVELKDEVSENTLKKRREYYLKHGVKNVFPCGLLESSSLDITTPYMLRNDGELLKCGDYHPYIKSYRKESLEAPNKIALTARHPNKNHLNSPTKLATKKSFALESLNDDLEEDIKLNEASQITDIEKLFSNSKIRDSKGNLLKCYHSSDNDFDKFEIKDNVNGRLYGSGIYFSTNSDYMFSYGKIGYECYLNIINPWYFVSSYEEIKNFIEKDTNKPVNEIKLKEYFAKGYGSDTTILDYYENVIKEEGITFKGLLIRNNYDGLIVCNDRDELEDRYTDIIAFDPNQIYIIKKYYSEKKNFGLDEDIEKHEELNPLLFENDELKPEIKEAIEKIVNQFVEDLKADGVKIEVKDIILVGSNVSYNYTKDSDLDIHIIVDKDNLDCDPELYTLLYGAYRSLFNKNYDITIKGIPAEIYVELY